MENDSKKNIAELCDAFLSLESKKEVMAFLKDLCTPQELTALSERWKVCRLLSLGKYSYREIHALTGASLTTIGRVSRFLKDEPYHGYQSVLDKMNSK